MFKKMYAIKIDNMFFFGLPVSQYTIDTLKDGDIFKLPVSLEICLACCIFTHDLGYDINLFTKICFLLPMK